MDAWDAYYYPGSNVLKNIPGLQTEEALRKFEYAVTRQNTEELRENPVQGKFDTAHLREIHRRLFHEVYEWAGQFRTVDMIKDRSSFAPLSTPAHTLESWSDKILTDLKNENHLKGLKTAEFVDRLTYHYGEINYAHPFREGNGRATKEFLAQMGKEAGYQIELDRVSAKTWNEAAARQLQRDTDMVTDVFTKITLPSRAVAFRDEHIDDAVRRYPELQGTANAMQAAEAKAATLHATNRRQFLANVQTQLLERLKAGELIQAPTPARDAPETPRTPDRGGR